MNSTIEMKLKCMFQWRMETEKKKKERLLARKLFLKNMNKISINFE